MNLHSRNSCCVLFACAAIAIPIIFSCTGCVGGYHHGGGHYSFSVVDEASASAFQEPLLALGELQETHYDAKEKITRSDLISIRLTEVRGGQYDCQPPRTRTTMLLNLYNPHSSRMVSETEYRITFISPKHELKTIYPEGPNNIPFDANIPESFPAILNRVERFSSRSHASAQEPLERVSLAPSPVWKVSLKRKPEYGVEVLLIQIRAIARGVRSGKLDGIPRQQRQLVAEAVNHELSAFSPGNISAAHNDLREILGWSQRGQ